MPRTLLHVAILAALALPIAAQAQEEASTGAAALTELDTIEVKGRAQTLYKTEESSLATRTPTLLKDVPQSVQVIPRELIDDQAARQVTDLYRNISGISFFSYAGVTLRGFRQENVLYDGLRGDPYAGFAVPQLFNIDRVEVLKGPAGASYGSGDPGGVVNYATKKPTHNTERQVELQLGDFDFFAGSVEASGPMNAQGSVRYRFGAYADTEEPFRFNTTSDTRIGDVGLAMDVGETGELTLQYTDVDQELGGNRLRGVMVDNQGDFLTDRRWNSNESTDFLNLQARIALARLTLSPTDVLDLDLAVRWFENGEQQQYHEARGLAANGRTVWREFRDQERENEGLTVNGNAVWRLDTGSLRHTLLAGAEAYRQDADFIGRTAVGVERGGPVPGLDLFDPVYGLSGADDYNLGPISYRPTSTRTQQEAVYVQDQVDVGERWHLLAGVRWDQFEDEDRLARSTVEGNDTTWRLGATYELNEAVNLYASAATGFLPQAAANQNPLAGGPFDPQQSEQWEIGAKTSFADGRFGINTAIYRIERSNLLQSTGEDPGNDGVDDMEALGLVRSDGLEIDLLADLTDRWVLNLAYGYNDARVVRGNPASAGNNAGAGSDRFANAPRHKFGFWTRYELPALKSAIALGGDYVGERVSLDGQPVKDYAIYDISWQTTLGNWSLQANVKNLFDKVYAASGFIQRTGHFPGEPRRVYLQARYTF